MCFVDQRLFIFRVPFKDMTKASSAWSCMHHDPIRVLKVLIDKDLRNSNPEYCEYVKVLCGKQVVFVLLLRTKKSDKKVPTKQVFY